MFGLHCVRPYISIYPIRVRHNLFDTYVTVLSTVKHLNLNCMHVGLLLQLYDAAIKLSLVNTLAWIF